MLLELVRGSAAAATGLRVGDVITEVDRLAIGSVQELADAMANEHDRLTLTVRRGRRVFLLLLQ
jgi:S1-C subfamily serine protease